MMLFRITLQHALHATFACALLVLSGCAHFSKEGGFDTVQTLVNQSIAQQPTWWHLSSDKQAIDDQVQWLLAEPLTINSAVQLALINNPALQSNLYDLLVAESKQVQASLVANPSFAILYAKQGDEYTIERSLTMNILSLLFRGKRVAIAKKEFEAQKQRAAIQVLSHAQQTRDAFIDAVSTKQKARYLLKICEASKVSVELASRMRQGGNWSLLDQARAEADYLTIVLQQQQAENNYVQALERLTRTLGLKSHVAIKLPDALASLPNQTEKKDLILTTSLLAERIDLQQAKWQSEALSSQLGLTQQSRWTDVIEIGPATVLEGERDSKAKKGIDLNLSVPLFDKGQAKVKQAEVSYQQFLLHAKSLAINAASEIRAQQQQYETSYQIAKRYHDEILPVHQTLVDESLLRYNGMLMSPFELIQTARTQIMVMNQYIEALQAFWLADSQLTMALVGPIQRSGE